MNEKLTVGSLFSGIGGLDLGLERTGGFEIKWQCEYDKHAQRILKKHWPGIPCYDDVRELYKTIFPEPTDLLCGGFPCQDVSTIGKRRGMSEGSGTRSSLYFEFARIIGAAKPRWVIVENVRGLLSIDVGRGVGQVFRTLSDLGYDAEGKIIPACSVGAPHQRQRVFIIAYPVGQLGEETLFSADTLNRNMGDGGLPLERTDWNGIRFDGTRKGALESFKREMGQPFTVGVDDGIPDWMDRNTRLGNAVVPQVAQYIGECILRHERGLK